MTTGEATAGDGGRRGDLTWGTTPRLVRQAADVHEGRAAIVDGDVTLSYRDLAEAVHQAARAYLAAGIEAGDRVAVWAPNLVEWIVAALGAHSAGAVLVPLNTRFKGHEAGDVVRARRRPHPRHGDRLPGHRLRRPVARGDGAGDGRATRRRPDRPGADRGASGAMWWPARESWSDFLRGGDDVASADADARALAVEPGDLSDILFTSGTTGRPKGVMTAHGQNLRAFCDWADVVGLRAGDRYLIINPFFHAFGYKAGILAAAHDRLDDLPPARPRRPRRHAPRSPPSASPCCPGTPTLYQTILNHPDFGATDFSSLRLAVTGAAAIPVELILRMRAELHFDTIITGYGLTESCGIATMCRYDDDPETIANTSGRAIPELEVRCVDDDGAEVPRGQPGEVVIRGYTVMRGYLDDPEATAEAIDADGWLHTGDIGVMDERGYLDITDRKKDMFIVGGFNAYPAEIENLMLANPAIAQVAVVGVPDERMGEVGVAFVVPRHDQTIDPDELVAWSRERMANYKAPSRVVVVDELPLNATGKVLKYELRDRAIAG